MPHFGPAQPEFSRQETAAVVDLAGGVPAAFSEIGPVELKGVSEATRLHVARRAE